MPYPYLVGTPTPRIFAHRGLVTPEAAARGIVENSREALSAAARAGADYLESDCRATRDGVVVLQHDADLTRVLGDDRSVASLTHRELAARMADRGELLTLEEALEAFPKARFNLDVKEAAVAAEMGRIAAAHADRVLLTSFSDALRMAAMRAAEATGPSRMPATSPGRKTLIRLLLALATGSRQRAQTLLSGVAALQIPERQRGIRVLSPKLIAAAHSEGVEVHVWTVNDTDDMQRLVDMGVDGIITDRVDRALAALRPQRGGAE